MTSDYCGITKIVSGGQTGVDRAALDTAIALGIAHGGWCPRDRLAEDGVIPARYQLLETTSNRYHVRTEQNVIDSDGTLIVFRETLQGGTELTRRLALRHGRPCLLVDTLRPFEPGTFHDWILTERIQVLNIAGPRESSAPGIGAEVACLLRQVLATTRT